MFLENSRLHQCLAALLLGLVPTLSNAQTRELAVVAVGNDANYQLGPGDQLRITIYGSPDPAFEVQVDQDGTISAPLLGRYRATGLTANALARLLAEEYRTSGYYRDPQVLVQVLAYRSGTATVSGRVERPGRYVLDPASSRLSEIVGQAGGITDSGSSRVTIFRSGPEGEQRQVVDVGAILQGTARDVEVLPGDRIVINAAERFYIRGAVQRPGKYEIDPGLTVGQALAVGGGLTDRGTARKVRLYRVVNGVRRGLRVSLATIVQQGDELVVGERLI